MVEMAPHNLGFVSGAMVALRRDSMARSVMARSMRVNHLEGNILKSRVVEFGDHLIGLGYAAHTVRVNLDSARHFAEWLKMSDISATDIGKDVIEQFAAHHCMWTYNRSHGDLDSRYIDRVRRFVRFLEQSELSRKGTDLLALPVDRRVAEFQDWLQIHRGLADRTIIGHGEIASRLVSALGTAPARYNPADIRGLIVSEADRHSRAYTAKIASVLRSYLRFLSARGECRPWLDQAVPTFADWRLSALPRYLAAADIKKLVDSCNPSKPHEIRDKAILLLLARLGLRAGDICAMRLGDIDWMDGTLRVRGKGRREIRLPLPQDAGDALIDYLSNYRPTVPGDHVFLRLSAPYHPWARSCAVSTIVGRALIRAGITNAPSHGANLLRHSAATGMLRAGASLDAVGSVLRHRSPNTTAHYAKVDILMLSRIAQPWMGEAPC
jgi:site-specific recombinase XerD